MGVWRRLIADRQAGTSTSSVWLQAMHAQGCRSYGRTLTSVLPRATLQTASGREQEVRRADRVLHQGLSAAHLHAPHTRLQGAPRPQTACGPGAAPHLCHNAALGAANRHTLHRLQLIKCCTAGRAVAAPGGHTHVCGQKDVQGRRSRLRSHPPHSHLPYLS